MKVSVIIPSYNSAGYLPATLRSVLGQTTPAHEVIVVDDGSTDATESVCETFKGRISYHKRPNGGVSAARNFGAEVATGDWLLFLDSDDCLMPNALELLLTAARESACRVVYGFVLQRGKTPLETKLNGYPYAVGAAPVPAVRSFWRSKIITPGSALVDRNLHCEVGGFVPGYEPMEDRDYWVKCGVLTGFGFCDACVLDKTWREGSASTQTAKRIRNGLRAQIEFFGWCRQHGIDPGFLKTDQAEIVERAIKAALFEKRRDLLPELLLAVRERGARRYWYYRARAELMLHGSK